MRRLNDEDGSMVVTVGVMFVALLVLLSMTVDTGILQNERAELQNGADAAALSVAFSCARSSGCDTSLASQYTTANARAGGTSAVESVSVDTAAGRVEVVTRTPDTPLEAAQLFGQDTALVRARGRARWGAAASIQGGTFPFAISGCDIAQGLATQGGYVDIPPAPAGVGTVILFHDSANPSTPECPNSFPFDEDGDGKLAGGFGKLELDGTAPCKVLTYADASGDVWAPVKTGASAPPDWRCLQLNQVNFIPIFGDFRVIAGANEYRIVGYSAFYVTGVRMPGYTANPPCGGSSTCISGWFTESVAPGGGPICTTSYCNYGVSVVKLSY
ncbi:MAG: pilus assembly protein TadG-related protein [Actinomycetota bacterium]|nr:pilus assembly protein TadG-related protein [Actinomycetota bacterium]